MVKYFKRVPLEAWVWIVGLAFLAVAGLNHSADLCLAKRLGLPCLGCGLGRSIAYLFHGDLKDSWHAHRMGIPAVLILFHRIWVLLRQGKKNLLVRKGDCNAESYRIDASA